MTDDKGIGNEVAKLGPLIRWELIGLFLQFMVLATAIIFNYASTQAKLAALDATLTRHIERHNEYLRVDIWEIRNKFIDSKLDNIERKIDLLIVAGNKQEAFNKTQR